MIGFQMKNPKWKLFFSNCMCLPELKIAPVFQFSSTSKAFELTRLILSAEKPIHNWRNNLLSSDDQTHLDPAPDACDN